MVSRQLFRQTLGWRFRQRKGLCSTPPPPRSGAGRNSPLFCETEGEIVLFLSIIKCCVARFGVLIKKRSLEEALNSLPYNNLDIVTFMAYALIRGRHCSTCCCVPVTIKVQHSKVNVGKSDGSLRAGQHTREPDSHLSDLVEFQIGNSTPHLRSINVAVRDGVTIVAGLKNHLVIVPHGFREAHRSRPLTILRRGLRQEVSPDYMEELFTL